MLRIKDMHHHTWMILFLSMFVSVYVLHVCYVHVCRCAHAVVCMKRTEGNLLCWPTPFTLFCERDSFF